MSLNELISEYGYLAIFVGTFLEGETIQILGGISAQKALLEMHWVIVIGCCGTLLGDQLYFLIGRRYGQRFIDSRPGWQKRVARVNALLERYHELAILSYRFFYGLRNVASFAMGASHIPFGRFVVFNALGAIIWATVMASLGYFFGVAAEAFVGKMKNYEFIPLLVLVLIGAGFFVRQWIKNRRELRTAGAETTTAKPLGEGESSSDINKQPPAGPSH